MATNRRRSTRTTRSSRSARASTPPRSRAVQVQPTPEEDQTARTRPGAGVDWDQEYQYIIKDLRQLGAVTALLIVLMLAVGFLI